MKGYFLTLVFILGSLPMMSQNLFEVKRINRYSFYKSNEQGAYFRIVVNDKSLGIPPTYPLIFPTKFDTLRAIGELLKMEGDTRLCALPVTNFSSARSQIYSGGKKDYSLQVEALFIINQLVYKNAYDYASYPILVDDKTGRLYTVGGVVVSNAFKAYKRWYKHVLGKGISFITQNKIMPLDNEIVRWY
jgi:hypothetical protein